MNHNIEAGLMTIRSMIRDTQEAFDDWKAKYVT